MFKVMIKDSGDDSIEEVKVYCHRDPNKVRLVFENKCEYLVDCLHHPELKTMYQRDAVINHFVNAGTEVVSI